MKKIASLYLSNLFFIGIFAIVLMYLLAFSFPFFFDFAYVSIIILFSVALFDGILLIFKDNPVLIKRTHQERMNLGDLNEISISIYNTSITPLRIILFEGYPIEMQYRNKAYKKWILGGETKTYTYQFKPKKRGIFHFGSTHYIVASIFGLWKRKYRVENQTNVGVYPSIVQMKKYDLMVFDQQKHIQGIKRIRIIGNNQEFEQIKNYAEGDDIRHINWKATSRKSELMVNQYQEEKSQQVYFLIDKSRTMQVEFEGMSMLDYAINSTLVIANITLKKGDKTGLYTFSDKIGEQLPAEKRTGQLKRIMEALYAQKTLFKEPNFELLFQNIYRTIKTRSLLMLYTNFETEFSMRRVLPLLRKLNNKHVLVLVLFQHSELEELAYNVPKNTKEVYQTVIAENRLNVKSKICDELNRNGIQTILTLPNDLNLNVINKYLTLKAKGII